jgi:hypothetical protein
MSTIKATQFGTTVRLAAGAMLFAAALSANSASEAGSSRSDLLIRQQAMQNSAEAANQRTLQERATAERQRQLLQYQIRKNQRMQMKMQCKAAGGGLGC